MLELTEKQLAFVRHITSTGDAVGNASKAARLAGYSEASSKEMGYQLLHKPHVRAAIFDANQAMISGELASKAVEVLQGIIEDENAPQKLRLDAAKTILDRAGVIPPKAPDAPDIADKGLEELSVQELQQQLDDLKAQRAANAQPH